MANTLTRFWAASSTCGRNVRLNSIQVLNVDCLNETLHHYQSPFCASNRYRAAITT